MSNLNIDKQANGNGAKNGAAKSNGGTPRAAVFSKNGIDLNGEIIDEMAKDASPMQLKNWITHLEALYDKKRADNRKELKKQVDKLLLSNDYSLEQLYAARPLPSTEELASLAKDRKKNNQSKRDQMTNGLFGA